MPTLSSLSCSLTHSLPPSSTNIGSTSGSTLLTEHITLPFQLNCSCQLMEDKNLSVPIHVNGVPSRKGGVGESEISPYSFSFPVFIPAPKFLHRNPVLF